VALLASSSRCYIILNKLSDFSSVSSLFILLHTSKKILINNNNPEIFRGGGGLNFFCMNGRGRLLGGKFLMNGKILDFFLKKHQQIETNFPKKKEGGLTKNPS